MSRLNHVDLGIDPVQRLGRVVDGDAVGPEQVLSDQHRPRRAVHRRFLYPRIVPCKAKANHSSSISLQRILRMFKRSIFKFGDLRLKVFLKTTTQID